MKKLSLLGPAVLLMAVSLIAGCGQVGSSDGSAIKIGVIMPLTGEGANWGENAKNAIELAIQEIEKRPTKHHYKLIYEDSKTDANTAVSAFKKLVNVDHVKYCIVDMISNDVLAIAPIANQNKVLILSPGASNPKITEAGDYVFRDWPSDALQGEIDAKVVVDRLKWKNIAILKINNDYGNGLAGIFARTLTRGAKIVDNESYEKGSLNFRTQLLKIKNTNPDGIYVLAYPEELPTIFKQIKELHLTQPLLGTETFESQQLLATVGNLADGAYYTFPQAPDSSSQRVKSFRADYQAKFGKPWGTPGDAAYDAVYLYIDAIEQQGDDVQKVKQAFYNIKNYPGVSGNLSIDKNGDAIKSFDLKQIKNQTFIKL